MSFLSATKTATVYKIHAFENVGNDTFTVNSGGEVDVLVVGGGGGTGSDSAAGGGAGGLVFSSENISAGSYTISVGDGGQNGTGNGDEDPSSNGDNSSAFGLLARGGGRGEAWGFDGGNGGSAGGAHDQRSFEPSATQPGTNPNAQFDLGNDGGDRPNDSLSGSGGGGAGGEGIEGANAGSGDGGPGFDMSQFFGTTFGENGFFAGGGGGSRQTGETPGSGGIGGGGDGGDPGEDGLPNTGGGAGGGEENNRPGGNGGSGIVLIRYEQGSVNASGGTTVTTFEVEE